MGWVLNHLSQGNQQDFSRHGTFLFYLNLLDVVKHYTHILVINGLFFFIFPFRSFFHLSFKKSAQPASQKYRTQMTRMQATRIMADYWINDYPRLQISVISAPTKNRTGIKISVPTNISRYVSTAVEEEKID